MRLQTLFEGRWIFLAVFLLGTMGGLLSWLWLILLAAAGLLFCINFFRDPDRPVTPGDDVVIAAADGVVARRG